jgi:hypothetical protein
MCYKDYSFLSDLLRMAEPVTLPTTTQATIMMMTWLPLRPSIIMRMANVIYDGSLFKTMCKENGSTCNTSHHDTRDYNGHDITATVQPFIIMRMANVIYDDSLFKNNV